MSDRRHYSMFSLEYSVPLKFDSQTSVKQSGKDNHVLPYLTLRGLSKAFHINYFYLFCAEMFII